MTSVPLDFLVSNESYSPVTLTYFSVDVCGKEGVFEQTRKIFHTFVQAIAYLDSLRNNNKSIYEPYIWHSSSECTDILAEPHDLIKFCYNPIAKQ